MPLRKFQGLKQEDNPSWCMFSCLSIHTWGWCGSHAKNQRHWLINMEKFNCSMGDFTEWSTAVNTGLIFLPKHDAKPLLVHNPPATTCSQRTRGQFYCSDITSLDYMFSHKECTNIFPQCIGSTGSTQRGGCALRLVLHDGKGMSPGCLQHRPGQSRGAWKACIWFYPVPPRTRQWAQTPGPQCGVYSLVSEHIYSLFIQPVNIYKHLLCARH